MRRKLAAWAAGLLVVPLAQGFEADEHRGLSDLAVAVVLAMADDGQRVRPQSPLALQALRQLAADYGRITECVDFFMFPEKILAYGWKLTPPAARPAVPPNSPGGVPSAAFPVWSGLLEQCQRDSLALIQASHSNHAHFQQDLLMSLRLWHFTAVALAQRENNYYGGLLINAMADHYLHDFFAPGHLVTPRDRLTDLPATATHDLANEMGALFRPNLSAQSTPGVLRVLDFLCGNTPDPAPPKAECKPGTQIEALLKDPRRHVRIDGFGAEVEALRLGHPVLLRGDGHLAGQAETRQRSLVLAVQAASILDVLEGSNGLTDLNFSYDMKTGQPEAKTNFGHYDFSVQGSSIARRMREESLAKAPSAVAVVRAAEYVPFKFTPCSLGGCKDTFYELRTRAPIFSLGLQRENHANGAFHARNVVTLEGSTLGLVWNASRVSGRWLDGVEFVPVLGYAYYRENHYTGNGPTFRLVASVPETEFSVSAYARWLSYATDDKARRLSYGLRADTGFSSYFTVYLTGGMDHVVTGTGELARSRTWGAGIRIGAPLTRLNPGAGKN
jgi:hypothetical protein